MNKTSREQPQNNAENPLQALTILVGNLHSLFSEMAAAISEKNNLGDIHKKIQFWLGELDAITRKLHDPAFMVGIIGEFSCGKSTFINAFVGQEILVGDILQGTTCAPTVLAYSPKQFISVKKTDGEILTHAACGTPELKKLLAYLSTEEDMAADIREIVWHAPLTVLSAGFCLMDTPGLGTLRQRHTAVTREAASHCDLLLVLTSLASSPLSGRLLSEMEKLTGNDAKNCIFIGTFADKFNNKQIDKLDFYFKQKLKSCFGAIPPYFFISAFAAIEEANNAADRAGPWLESFEKFKADLLEIITQNKIEMRARRITRLLRQFLPTVKQNINEMLANALFQNMEMQQFTIMHDLEKAGMDIRRDFTASCQKIRSNCERLAFAEIESFHAGLESCIINIANADRLKKYLGKGINSDFDKLAKSFGNILHAELLSPMMACADEHIEKITNLGFSTMNVPISMSIGRSKSSANLTLINFRPEDLNEVNANHENEEKRKIGGGLGAGIALAMLVPGAGWLAGGFMALGGMFMGALFMPGINDLKKSSLKKLNATFSKLRNDASRTIGANYTRIHALLLSRIDMALRNEKNVANALEVKRSNELKIAIPCLEKGLASLNQLETELNKIF